MKKRKKYAVGSTVKSYLKQPNDVIAQLDINAAKAQYEAESNPWIKGLQVGGSLLTDFGINMLAPKIGDKAAQGLTAATTGYEGLMASFANGGVVGNIPIEAEGEEIVETPNGQMTELDGPSHEQGGIDLDLPEGTEIYSKRVKIDGVSMADRKKNREKKSITLEKLLAKRKNDALLQNTSKLTNQNNEAEEKKDVDLQNFISQLMEAPQKAATGGTMGNPPPYADGFNMAGYFDYLSHGIELPKNDSDLFSNIERTPGVVDLNYATSPATKPTPNFLEALQNSEMSPAIQPEASGLSQGFLNNVTATPTASQPEVGSGPKVPSQARMMGKAALDGLKNVEGEAPTFGDATSLVGSLVSSFGPYLNTLKNRGEDSPNQNFFSQYGEDGLQTYEDSLGYLEGMRNKNLSDATLGANATKKSMRNSARGVNTQRALDITAQNQDNRNKNTIYNNFSAQMMQMLQGKAGMQNQVDQVRMGGEGAKDMANRQDRDQFNTNKAKDLTNMGLGLQNIGQDINQIKYRGDTVKNIEALKQAGIDEDTLNMIFAQLLKTSTNPGGK